MVCFLDETIGFVDEPPNLKTLDIKDRMVLLIKLIPFILSKINTIHHTENEAIAFG